MNRVILYQEERPGLKIHMELYFANSRELHFDGQDRGSWVEEHWGDYDYEYTYTIKEAGVLKLYEVLSIKEGDQTALLELLQERFSGNSAYSMFGQFMRDHEVPFENFRF